MPPAATHRVEPRSLVVTKKTALSLVSSSLVGAAALVALAASPTSSAPATAPANPGPAAAGGRAAQPAVVSTETKEHKDARMNWWREARFGMFIHWGLYAVPAGVYQGRNI